ncbi:MAG: hypothetical protein E6J41_17035 [Chloroflexi bacterium]|nr:MAG: hypothetical protein E6J41_17035 [Chloroflexota bacterium]
MLVQVDRAIERHARDLADGTWDRDSGHLRTLPELDMGTPPPGRRARRRGVVDQQAALDIFGKLRTDQLDPGNAQDT